MVFQKLPKNSTFHLIPRFNYSLPICERGGGHKIILGSLCITFLHRTYHMIFDHGYYRRKKKVGKIK